MEPWIELHPPLDSRVNTTLSATRLKTSAVPHFERSTRNTRSQTQDNGGMVSTRSTSSAWQPARRWSSVSANSNSRHSDTTRCRTSKTTATNFDGRHKTGATGSSSTHSSLKVGSSSQSKKLPVNEMTSVCLPSQMSWMRSQETRLRTIFWVVLSVPRFIDFINRLLSCGLFVLRLKPGADYRESLQQDPMLICLMNVETPCSQTAGGTRRTVYGL